MRMGALLVGAAHVEGVGRASAGLGPAAAGAAAGCGAAGCGAALTLYKCGGTAAAIAPDKTPTCTSKCA